LTPGLGAGGDCAMAKPINKTVTIVSISPVHNSAP
jgi:hypothetical protein